MTNKPTPAPVYNRAGLPRLHAREGRHGDFLAAMRRGLADANRPGLSELRPQEEGDFTLGLIEAYARVLDTITFYKERQVNEQYLRTATERESLRAHAALVGYQLAPAKAAACYMAFTAEPVNAPQDVLTYPPGLQIRSVPRDGEVPQIFETIAPLRANAGWNALRPRMSFPQVLTSASGSFQLAAGHSAPEIGAPVLLMQSGVPQADAAGVFLRRVSGIAEGLAKRKILSLRADPVPPSPYLFLALTVIATYTSGTALSSGTLAPMVLQQAWSAPALSGLLTGYTLAQANAVIAGLSAAPGDPVLPHEMKVRAGFFGNTAVTKYTVPTVATANGTTTATGHSYSRGGPGGIDQTAGEVGQTPPSGKAWIYLDREETSITPGQALLIRDSGSEAWFTILGAETTGVEGYGLSSKVTRLEVAPNGTGASGNVSLSAFSTRRAQAFARPEPLPLADMPIRDDVGVSTASLSDDQIELGVADLGLIIGQKVAITGMRSDLTGIAGAEVREIAENIIADGHSVLRFTQALTYPYLRETVQICANLAEATHGETVAEVLGHGDATKSFQSFTLKSKPLTHVSAVGGSGLAPALEVRVDGVLWTRVEDFRAAGPEDHVYIVRIAENSAATVTFGDGISGQRLPTGHDTVRAVYRRGAGLSGMLEAGQLSLLAGKPAGLKGVTNPLPPAGGADGEVLEQARSNAPLRVLTLGRVVSLRDYEDFARGYGGIAKARADWTFDGFSRPVYLTVAGQGGALLPETGSDMTNLAAALRAAGEAGMRVYLRNYTPVRFGLAARLYGDPAYMPDDIKNAAQAAILAAFSFDARALGQGVSAAQVIAVLQGVAGVLGVDLDLLYRIGTPATLASRLTTAVAQPDLNGAVPVAAELLSVDPASVLLEVVT
jgi:hypothetical protein